MASDEAGGEMAAEAETRKSVTAEQLAAQVAKLNSVETVEKSALPTAEDIATDGDAQAAAEAALQQGKEALKTAETEEKNKLPTVDDINAERSAALEAAEILAEGKRKLSAAATVEKNVLPSAADIKAEKDDKACDVASDQMAKAAASRAAAAKKGSGLGTVKNTMAFGAGAGGGFGLNAPGLESQSSPFLGLGRRRNRLPSTKRLWTRGRMCWTMRPMSLGSIASTRRTRNWILQPREQVASVSSRLRSVRKWHGVVSFAMVLTSEVEQRCAVKSWSLFRCDQKVFRW